MLGSLIIMILMMFHLFYNTEQYNQHMELHLHAVKVALEHLTIPLEKENRKYIQSRLIKIQLCQNAIDSILTLSQGNEMAEEIR